MNYQEILKQINWPTEVLIIDFECYFDQEYTLSKIPIINYICDERFEFTGAGYQILSTDSSMKPAFEPKTYVQSTIKNLQVAFGQQLEHATVVAKNCKFDMTTLSEKFGIIPPYIIDIDDLLRHYDARMSHKMKDVAPMFGLQPKGDTNQFKGLHYEDMSEEQREALVEYGKNDIDIEVNLFKILLPKIINPTIEIPVARHTLDLYLRPKIKFDFEKAGELRAKMLEELDKIVDTTGHKKKGLSGNLSFVKLLQEALPEGEQVPVKLGKPGKNMVKLLGYRAGVIPAFAKDDEGFQELLVHPDEKVRNLCMARQAIKSWPLHLKRIDNMTYQADASGGLLRVDLKYYGAHTGRWSGSGGINLQNLGGRGRGGQGTHPLISAMRNLLCASDGNILGIADSAQIEARILAWLAGQEDLVSGFANGEDIYSVFATKLFNSCVYEPKDDEPDSIKRLLKIRRGFGKDAILGAGYGMGTNKFYNNCLVNSDLRPFFDSGEYDRNFINKLIKTYRTTYARIPEFWTSVEKAFKWVIKYPHETIHVPGFGISYWFEHDLQFWNDKGTVHIRLPSGRELTYRHCALKQTARGSEIRWHYGHLWGGSITENIVQACARDLLAWWILEMDKAGLSVVLTAHDEIICMLSEGQAQEKLQQMLNIMRTGPKWAAGLPLGVKGKLSEIYVK